MISRNNTLKFLSEKPKATKAYVESWKLVKKQLQQVFLEIQDDATPRYIALEQYELCLACNDYKLGTIRNILRYCTSESIKENEVRIRNFYMNVCKFEPVVIDMLIAGLVNHAELPESYMGIFAEIPSRMSEYVMAKEPKFHDRLSKDSYIKIYIHPDHTKEDVKWFIDHELKKVLQDNSNIRQNIRIPKKGFVERMLIGRLSFMQQESSMGIAETLKAIAELDCDNDSDIELYTTTDIELIKNKSRKKYAGAFDDLESEFKLLLEKYPKMYRIDTVVARAITNLNKFKLKSELRKACIPRFKLTYSDKDDRFHLVKV